MHILFVGEYSRFHNSLAEGLHALGHQTTIISDNDFKAYPLDYSIYAHFFKDYWVTNAIRQVLFRLTKLDLAQVETALRFYRHLPKLKNFEIVQLVNEYPIQTPPRIEQFLLKKIFQQNDTVYTVSCGDDFPSVTYMHHGDFKYSVMTPCFDNPTLGHCPYTLKYISKPFEKLHRFVYKHVKAVIPADMDYSIPLKKHPKATELVPYPINVDKHLFSPLEIEDRIVIFHGINEANYYKKGNRHFEEALEIIEKKIR